MTCPAVTGYAVLKSLLGFGWTQVENLKKKCLFKKKMFFLLFSLSHIKMGCMLPTSEQAYSN